MKLIVLASCAALIGCGAESAQATDCAVPASATYDVTFASTSTSCVALESQRATFVHGMLQSETPTDTVVYPGGCTSYSDAKGNFLEAHWDATWEHGSGPYRLNGCDYEATLTRTP